MYSQLSAPNLRRGKLIRSADMSDDHWMEKAFSKNKGKLHRETGTPQGRKIPAGKLDKAKHSKSGTERKEANLAETARKIGIKKGK